MRFPLLLLLLPLVLLGARAQGLPLDSRSGKLMYDAWCARCHAPDGSGRVEDLQLEAPAPDFTDCSFNSREPRKDWKAVIAHGGPVRGLSWSMPSWGHALTGEQIDSLIGYIKTFCTDERWPQGELNFRRAQRTTKAFPENELLIIPTYTRDDRGTLRTAAVYERRIGPRGQWEIALPFIANGLNSASGIGDIEVGGKYTVFDDADQLWIVSGGLEVGVPTGSVVKNTGSGLWKVVPFAAAGKGFGNLFLQASIKYEKPLSPDRGELVYDLALSTHLTEEKRGALPMIELNGVTSIVNGESTLMLTPQLYIGLVKRGHLAFSVGAQIPVAGTRVFEYRIVAFFLWEYLDGGLWW